MSNEKFKKESLLPDGWDIKKLGDVCSFTNGKAHEKNIDMQGKYILINSKFISSNGVKYKQTNALLSPLFNGDIVLVMSDVPNGKALAKCFLIDEDDTYTLNQRICVIRSNKYNKQFLYYHLNRHKDLLKFNNGENQTNLRKQDILDCPLCFPPLSEQERIVGILDEAFEAIDKAKENSEQNLKNANELFQSKLQAIFDEGKSKVQTGEWEAKRLGDVLLKTETVNPQLTPDAEFVYLDVSCVNKETKKIDSTVSLLGKDAPSRARKLVKTGDVIFATVRPTHGRVTIIPKELNNQVCSTGYYVLRAKEILTNNFVYYFILTDEYYERMEELQKGASYPAVTNKDVESIKICFPKSLMQQQQIVENLDIISAETNKLELNYQKKIEDLEELKTSILQKAFSGEL